MKKAIQIAYNDMFEAKCRYAKEAGFAHIAVNFTEVLDKTEYQWQTVTEDIQRILEENRLECVQSHPYYYDLLISSELEEDRYEFAIEQAIIASGKLGAAWCAQHPRTSLTTGRYVSASFSDNRKAFSRYLDCAVKHGTGIAVENLPTFRGVSPQIPFYSSNYEDLQNFVDSFASDKMAICWDTGHAHLMRFDQAQVIRELGKRIVCTHIHNNDRTIDSHFPPDNGTIDWEAVMSALHSVGYTGPLTLETHCKYQVEALLRNFARHNFVCLEYLESLMK